MFRKILEIWNKGKQYDKDIEEKQKEIGRLKETIRQLEERMMGVVYEKKEAESKKESLLLAVQKMLSENEIEKLERYRIE